MRQFSQDKFCQLMAEQQHKHLAKLLKQTLDNPALLDTYNLWASWIGLEPVDGIEDRFHFHLAHSGRGYKEHDYLIRTQDLAKPKADPLSICIYLDGIRSAHNVGSIIRTAEAFQLGELYFSPNMAPATHKQVQDAAMGAHKHIRCHENIEISSLPHPIIALETADGATDLFDMRWPEQFTLVLGNEERGCSPQVLRAADEIVQIPLVGRKNSLNVACAFALTAGVIRNYSLRRSSP